MSRKVARWLLFVPLVMLLSWHVSALAMPPKPGLLEPDPLTGLSKLTGKPIVLPPRPQGLNRPEPFKAELVTGTNNVLIIVIAYPDLPATQTVASFTDMANGPWTTGSLDDYYREVSYGVFGVSGITYGWYTAPNNHTYYANFDGISGTDDDYGLGGAGIYPHNAARLVEEAVDAAEAAGVNFSNYDNDGDGFVDTVFIVHAGKDGAATGDPNDIWSHKWRISSGGGTSRYYDGVWINAYTIQPEINSQGGHIEIGVFAHEYGHVLGLPDLYDTDGGSYGIGFYGLMAYGAWGADGFSPERPSHMCAWSKVFLGWVTPTIVTQNTSSQAISQITTSPKVYELWKDGAPQNEYFLVSNRQKVGFDSRFSGLGGLLIWHIDENVINANLFWNTVNADENHKGVDLEEADGLNDLDHERNPGDGGDFYPGSTNNTVFNDTSNPNSRAYSGATTKIGVSNISSSGNPMRADFDVGIVTNQVLEVDPSFLNLGEVGKGLSKTMTFRVYNAGGGILNGTISANRNWIIVSPTTFEGNDNTISVTVDTEKLTESSSPNTGAVTVTSNGGTKTVEISVTVIPFRVVAYPNPFSLSGHSHLTFWGSYVRHGKIQIFTLTGKLVRTLVENYGASTLQWDGRNETGSEVAGGIYIYIIKGSRGKIALLK